MVNFDKNCQPSSVLTILVSVFISVGFTTNSCILVEDYATMFFLASTIITVTMENISRMKGNDNILKELFIAFAAGTSSRLTSIFYGCREEQFWCRKTWWLDDSVHRIARNRVFLGSTAALTVNRILLYFRRKHTGNIYLFKRSVYITEFILTPIQILLIACYWALTSTQSNILTEQELCWLPRTVYLISYIDICVTVSQLNSIRIIRKEKLTPVAFGLQGALTSPLISVYGAIIPVLTLLLGMGLSSVLLLLTVEVLAMTHLLRFKDLNVRVVSLHLLTLQFFYATGHQAAVQQIDWNAAFIGFTRHANNFIPGIIIGLRTLMAVVITAILAPVLILSLPIASKAVSKVDTSREKVEGVGDMRYIISPHLLTTYLHKFVIVTEALLMFKCTWAVIACYIHRRHLMIWNIFTPRVVLEMAIISSFLFSLAISLTFLYRIYSVVSI